MRWPQAGQKNRPRGFCVRCNNGSSDTFSTKRALKRAYSVCVSSMLPCSQYMLLFLKTILSPHLGQCMFDRKQAGKGTCLLVAFLLVYFLFGKRLTTVAPSATGR